MIGENMGGNMTAADRKAARRIDAIYERQEAIQKQLSRPLFGKETGLHHRSK